MNSLFSVERISIEPSTRCDKACWFCYNRSGPRGEGQWRGEELVDFVRDCAEHGVKAVSFGGGEPLQFAPIYEVLAALHGVLFRSLTTNGLLLDDVTFKRLAKVLPTTHHTVPAGLPHSGGDHDYAWPYGWPELLSSEWESMHKYVVTEDSHGIYRKLRTPSEDVVEITHRSLVGHKIDPLFLQSLPVTFRETDWIVPHQLIRCELFDQSLGPFPLGSLAQVAYVDLRGQLSPLPKSVGDPRAFFTCLADLVIWSAKFHVPVNRSIRGMFHARRSSRVCLGVQQKTSRRVWPRPRNKATNHYSKWLQRASKIWLGCMLSRQMTCEWEC